MPGYRIFKNDEEYVDFSRVRFKETFQVLKPFLTAATKVYSVGVSPFDDYLADSFPPGVTLSPLIPYDGFVSRDKSKRDTCMVFDLASPQPPCIPECDILIFTEVLEHLLAPDDVVIENASSVIKKGGVLVFSVPNAAAIGNRVSLLAGKNVYPPKDGILHGTYGGYGHIREYTFSEVERLLRQRFDIVATKGINGQRHGFQRIFNALPKAFANTILVVGRKR